MIRHTLLAAAVLAGAFSGTTVAATGDDIRFVRTVPKSCKHLGSVRHQADNTTLFEGWSAFKAVDGGPVFADGMREKARALGANRLVIVDIFHDVTVTTGARVGMHESVDATDIRARAFKCQ